MTQGLTEGSKFGDYRVVRRLGKGGMGEVWLLANASGGLVAAKILDPATAADHESRRRFLREAELALGVKHPNLVETYDVGEDPDTGLCYILMEYVSGGTLADYLKTNGAMPIDDAVAVVEAMARVLELGWQKGIVHRDIKPANIMFASGGTPKLADLGIARGGLGGTDTTTVTRTGMLIGTPAYMSPEQMLDAHNVDTRADIYSLGVVFFEMLTGQRPNKDDTIVQLMAKAVKGEPLPDVRTLRPEVSASLAQLLSMMVVPDKDGRISTPGQITNALAIIERGGTFEKPKANAATPSGKPKEGRRFPWKVLIPVGLLASFAAAFWMLAPRKADVVEKTVARETVKTNVVEKVIEKESVVKRPQISAKPSTADYQSPYRRKKVSELGPNSQKRLKYMASCRSSGERRGTMVFGTIKVDGRYSGEGIAGWAWLWDDGWFCADVHPNGKPRHGYAGGQLGFAKHGYEPIEIDLRHEAGGAWSDADAYDLGCLEMKRLSVDRQCAISATIRLPVGVPEGELILSLYNKTPCGNDWGTRGRQNPTVEVLKRRFRSGEEIRIDGCSPTDYKIKVSAEGCICYKKDIDASDASARNLKKVSLLRVRRATFATRPFSGGEWTILSVLADNDHALHPEGRSGRHSIRLDPYKNEQMLTASSFHQPSTFDDYGALTTNMIDRQLETGSAAAPVSLNYGDVRFVPGRIYRFRCSHVPIDVLVAFLDYREEPLPVAKAAANAAAPSKQATQPSKQPSKQPTQPKKEDRRVRLATAGGYEWCYTLEDGKAVIGRNEFGYNGRTRPAISPSPFGHLEIPSELDGHPVKAIGSQAFFKCRNMTSVTIPEGVERIDSWAFYECRGLKEVNVPASLRTVKDIAFDLCGSLESIDLKNCTQFDGSSFQSCGRLAKITIRSDRTNFTERDGGIYAENGRRLVFWPRTSQTAKVPDGVVTIGAGAFCSCSVRTVQLPSSVRKIETKAFSLNKFLEEVVMSEGVEDVGPFAFALCHSLQRVVFPSTVRKLGCGLFDGDDKLAFVAFRGDAPELVDPWRGSVFGKASKSCEILVLKGSKGWRTDGAEGLPSLWPDETTENSRPIRAVSEDEMDRLVAVGVSTGENAKSDWGTLPPVRTKEEVEERLKRTRIKAMSFKTSDTIVDVVDFFRSELGLNFLLRPGESIPQMSTLTASDLAAREALKLACDAVNYKYEVHNNIVVVIPKGARSAHGGSHFNWTPVPKGRTGQVLRDTRLPELSVRPPMTIADFIAMLREALKDPKQQKERVNWVAQTAYDSVPPALPTMALRDVSVWDALDLVCQSCAMGVKVEDKTVVVKPLSMMQGEGTAKDASSKSKFTPQQIKRMGDSDGWNAMRKATEVMFPGWRICDRLKKTLPSLRGNSWCGYKQAEGADVLLTVGTGDMLETKEVRTIRKNSELRFRVHAARGTKIGLKGSGQRIVHECDGSCLQEVVVDLSEYAGNQMRLVLFVERPAFGAGSEVFSGVTWSDLELRTRE